MLKDADNGIHGERDGKVDSVAAHLKADSMTDDRDWELGNWEIWNAN